MERMLLLQALQRADVRLVAQWAAKFVATHPEALDAPGAAEALQLLHLAGVNASGSAPTSAGAAARG